MLDALPGPAAQRRGSIPRRPTPARAANLGIEMAESDFVGLAHRRRAHREPGPARAGRDSRAALADAPDHRDARVGISVRPGTWMPRPTGYDQAAEDALLAELDWEHDGYRLFSSARSRRRRRAGWFRADGGEQRAVHAEVRCGTSSAASTRRSRSRAAGSRTTTSTAGPASSTACSSSCCSARERSTRSTAARRRRAGIGWDEMHDEYVDAARAPVPPPRERPALRRRSSADAALAGTSRDSATCARLDAARAAASSQALEVTAGVERERRTSPSWCRPRSRCCSARIRLHRFAAGPGRTRATPDGR